MAEATIYRKFLTALFLLLAVSTFGAVPSYTVFRGAGGIFITTNPPNGTIVIDGSGVVATGTNSSIRASTNGTTVSAGATNNNFTAGRNVVLKGTNIGSTAHINYSLPDTLDLLGNLWVGGSAEFTNGATFDGGVGFNDEAIFNAAIKMPLGAVNGYVATTDATGLLTWAPPTASGTNVNIGVGQTLYLDSSFGNDATAQRTNLVRTYRTASNAVPAMLSGDKLEVRPGTNLIAPNPGDLISAFGITNKSDIHIRGGPGSVWQLANWGSTNHGSILTLYGVTNATIEGLTFVGLRTNNVKVKQSYAIRLLNCGKVTIKNCNFINWQNQAITDLGPNHETMNQDLEFSGNTFSFIGGTNHITLGGDGAAIAVNASNMVVFKNVFKDCYRHIELYDNGDVQGVLIAKNISYRCFGQCIQLTSTNCSDIQIIGNQDYGYSTILPTSVLEGIWIETYGCSNVLIQGNIVRGLSGVIWNTAGLTPPRDLSDCKIWNNSFEDSAYRTILARQFADGVGVVRRLSIKGNEFKNTLYPAIEFTGNNSVVEDNEFFNCNTQNTPPGVIIAGYSDARYATNSTNIVITGNIIGATELAQRANADGINIYSECYSNVVFGNEVDSRFYRTNIHNVGVGTLTRPVNLVAAGSLLRTDAAGRERAVTIGSGIGWDGTNLTSTGGSGTPAGSNFEIQYNGAGAFAASPNFRFLPSASQFQIKNPSASAEVDIDGEGFISQANGGKGLALGLGGKTNLLIDIQGLLLVRPPVGIGTNIFQVENTNQVPVFAVTSNGVVQIGSPVSGAGYMRIYAANSNYVEINGGANISTNMVQLVETNNAPGVRVFAPVVAGSTNQAQAIPLTAGQTLAYNGTNYLPGPLSQAISGATSNQNIQVDFALGWSSYVIQDTSFSTNISIWLTNTWAAFPGRTISVEFGTNRTTYALQVTNLAGQAVRYSPNLLTNGYPTFFKTNTSHFSLVFTMPATNYVLADAAFYR